MPKKVFLTKHKIWLARIFVTSLALGTSILALESTAFADRGDGGPSPIPGQPVPPPPPPPVDSGESQCQWQIPQVQQQLNRCSAATRELLREQDQARYDLNRIEYQWQVAMAPVFQCQSQLSNEQNVLQSIQSNISAQRSRQAQSEANIQVIRQRLQEAAENAAGQPFVCVVVGRHQNFVATAPSASEALQSALAQCGSNNCGKNDWTANWSCTVKN